LFAFSVPNYWILWGNSVFASVWRADFQDVLTLALITGVSYSFLTPHTYQTSTRFLNVIFPIMFEEVYSYKTPYYRFSLFANYLLLSRFLYYVHNPVLRGAQFVFFLQFQTQNFTSIKTHECVTLRRRDVVLNVWTELFLWTFHNFIKDYTRWFKHDRDWFVCKQAALRSSCATLRGWSHNLHPPSCSGENLFSPVLELLECLAIMVLKKSVPVIFEPPCTSLSKMEKFLFSWCDISNYFFEKYLFADSNSGL
jgi:hypothetical protein